MDSEFPLGESKLNLWIAYSTPYIRGGSVEGKNGRNLYLGGPQVRSRQERHSSAALNHGPWPLINLFFFILLERAKYSIM